MPPSWPQGNLGCAPVSSQTCTAWGQLTCTGGWQEACCKDQRAKTGGSSAFCTRLSFKSSWSVCPLNVLGYLIFLRQNCPDPKRYWRLKSDSRRKPESAWGFFFKRNFHSYRHSACPPASTTVPPYFQSVAFVYKNSSNIDFFNSVSGVSLLRG